MRFRLPWNRICKQPEPERVWKGTLCPCWDNDWTLCLHPDSVYIEKLDVSRFSDEPHEFKVKGQCKHKRYTGVTIYQPRSMTKTQFYEYIENHTGCFHPEEHYDATRQTQTDL